MENADEYGGFGYNPFEYLEENAWFSYTYDLGG